MFAGTLLVTFVFSNIVLVTILIKTTKIKQEENKIIQTVILQPEILEPQLPTLPLYNIPLSTELQQYTFNLCNQYNLSYELVLAIMWQESKMETDAINKNRNGTKDGGLMQLNSAYHKSRAKMYDIKDFNVLNPQHNILMAVRLIKDLESSFINKGYYDDNLIFAVLGSYNMGEDGYVSYIKCRHKQPSYVYQVLAYKEQLETINTFSDFS